jgi:hypothetical protein
MRLNETRLANFGILIIESRIGYILSLIWLLAFWKGFFLNFAFN